MMASKSKTHATNSQSAKPRAPQPRPDVSNNPSSKTVPYLALTRALSAPCSTWRSSDIFDLQRTLGNQSIQRLVRAAVQRKALGREEERAAQLSSPNSSNARLAQLQAKTPDEEEALRTKPLVQRRRDAHTASSSREDNQRGLPESLRSGIETLSGIVMDDVKVHRNSSKPSDVQALAYTEGTNIYLGPGQERHLPHEAWHVVQQKLRRVRPTAQAKGFAINDDQELEREADVMGTRALEVGPVGSFQIGSAAHTATAVQRSGVVQRREQVKSERFDDLLKGHEPGFEKGQITEPTGAEATKGGTESSEDALIETKAKLVKLRIDEAVERSEDTFELAAELEKIKVDFGLKSIEMVNLGRPGAAVRFEINPWFLNPIAPGKVVYRMLGTESTPLTTVDWLSEDLKIGSQTAKVGTHMVAKPLAPDHEPGSKSTNDTAQASLMGELANAGTTSVPNDQKYIKGHLLNDHVGGPGLSFNLFPITADANAKHLAYIEKFVKAQLAGHYVIYYEVQVAHSTPVDINSDGKTPYKIDSDFNFRWYLLDTTGLMIKAAHSGKVESRYNATGALPFDVTTEYVSEYDKLNTGKGTPKALPQTGQWQEPSISSPGMSGMSLPTTTLGSLTLPSGSLGSTSTTTVLDFSGLPVKVDTSGEFISVRNKDAAAATKGASILVAPASAPRTVVIKIINPLSGGWTRIYF